MTTDRVGYRPEDHQVEPGASFEKFAMQQQLQDTPVDPSGVDLGYFDCGLTQSERTP